MSTIKVNNITNANGTSAIAIDSSGVATFSKTLVPSSSMMYRNLIINGDMRIAQRATSVAGSTAAAAYISLDRWASHASGATYNISQDSVTVGGETGLPTTFTKYLKFNPTTGADNCGIWQTIEDVDSVQGTYTLSFYAKGTNPAGGSIGISLSQNFGSGGSTTVTTTDAETFTLTGTWQRFTFTITPPSITGKTIGTASYYRIFFNQKADDNSATAWTLDITGVQLEVGDTATPFEHRPYDMELARCQRYYYKRILGLFGVGWCVNTTTTSISITFPTSMRTAPTALETTGTANNYQVVYLASAAACSVVPAFGGETSTESTRVDASVASGLTAGQGAGLRSGTSGVYLAWSAEL